MKIAFVGDVMLGRLVNQALRSREPQYPWGDTLGVLRRADLRVGNLEFVLADDGHPWPGKEFHFRSDSANVESLRTADFRLVSLANNHVLDYGADALLEQLGTLDRWEISHAGAGVDRDGATRAAAYLHDDLTVALLAFTDNEPDWDAAPGGPGVNFVPVDAAIDRTRHLLGSVRRTAAEANLLIVSAHWGGNWGTAAPAAHRALAHDLIDAGAHVVYGHSPHVFRGVEVYRNRPILYGTGDFVDDYAVDPFEHNDESFIFVLETERDIPTALRLYPTEIVEFQARMARDAASQIARRMQALCSELGTESTWLPHDGCLVIPLNPPAPSS